MMRDPKTELFVARIAIFSLPGNITEQHQVEKAIGFPTLTELFVARIAIFSLQLTNVLSVAPRSLARPPRRLSSTHPPSLDRSLLATGWQRRKISTGTRCTSLQRGRITACSSTTISDG